VLWKLAEHKKAAIRKEVYWIISNITAGSTAQIESIMGNPTYVEKLLKAVREEEEKVHFIHLIFSHHILTRLK